MLFPFKQIQEHKLRFVQFLPDVVRLQRLLMDRFHRRIDRTDAENYTVREFLKDLPTGIWWVTNLYPILPMQKVDVLSCFSNSKLRLAGAPFLASFSTGFFLTTRMKEVSKLLHFHSAEMWLLDFNFLNLFICQEICSWSKFSCKLFSGHLRK